MNLLHRHVVAGWGGDGAEVYERARPGYPSAVVELIEAELGAEPGTRLLDLAAGTGKLTRELISTGAEVIAVEPVAQMRAQLAAASPGVEVLEGTAESIPLPDGSIHAVTVAQAFHWFDVPRACAEIHRVLDPTGGIAVLRNDWGEQDPGGWLPQLQELLQTHSRRDADHGNAWIPAFERTGLFGPLQLRLVPNDLKSDIAGLQARVASLSFIAAMDETGRQMVLDEVEGILRFHGIKPGEEFTVPNVVAVRWALRR